MFIHVFRTHSPPLRNTHTHTHRFQPSHWYIRLITHHHLLYYIVIPRFWFKPHIRVYCYVLYATYMLCYTYYIVIIIYNDIHTVQTRQIQLLRKPLGLRVCVIFRKQYFSILHTTLNHDRATK